MGNLALGTMSKFGRENTAASPTARTVTCSLELAGFDDAIPWWRTQGKDISLDGAATVPPRFTQATYASVPEIRDTPDEVVRVLMNPWLATFYEGRDLIDSLL